MPTPFTQARLDELDALLRVGGIDISEIAKRWQVQPARVKEYFTTLGYQGATIVCRCAADGKKRYFYGKKRYFCANDPEIVPK